MRSVEAQLQSYAGLLEETAPPLPVPTDDKIPRPPLRRRRGAVFLAAAASVALVLVAGVLVLRAGSGGRGGNVRTGDVPPTAPAPAAVAVAPSGWEQGRITPAPVVPLASITFQGHILTAGPTPFETPSASSRTRLVELQGDGTWTELPEAPDATGGMATDGTALVVIGNNLEAWRTTDLVSWTKVDDGNLLQSGPAGFAVGPKGWLIVGSDHRTGGPGIWFSADGTSFQRVEPAIFPVAATTTSSSTPRRVGGTTAPVQVTAVAATDDGYVAAGYARIDGLAVPAFWRSTDGRTWIEANSDGTPRPEPGDLDASALVTSGSAFLARDLGLYRSLDGGRWVQDPDIAPNPPSGGRSSRNRSPLLAANRHGFAALALAPGSDERWQLWVSADAGSMARADVPELALPASPFGPRPLLVATDDGFVAVVGDTVLRWSA